MNLNQSSIAVIIGCWEDHTNKVISQCYNNIISNIIQNKFIHSIVLSGNHSKINADNQGTNQWYSNSENIFLKEQGVGWIRDSWTFSNNQIHEFSAQPSKLIKDYNWNLNCITASEQWQMEYLMNHIFVDTINVWFFGIGWNYGVMRDPIGWGHFYDLTKFNHIKKRNLLTDTSCIIINDNDGQMHPDNNNFVHPSNDKHLHGWNRISNQVFLKDDNTHWIS